MRSGVYWKVHEHSKSKFNEEVRQKTKALTRLRVCSSVGLEHTLDKRGVGGSSPPRPTNLRTRVVAKKYLYWLFRESSILL